MRKKVWLWGLAVLSALAISLACTPSVKLREESAEKAVTVDELCENLDMIGGSQGRALLPAGSIPKPDGSPFSAEELNAYIDGIRVKLAAYVQSRTANKPYLVMPVRLHAQNGQSGLMWVPVSIGRTLQLPIIAFQHGTQVYRLSAPSRYNANPLAILSNYDVAGAFQNYIECMTAALMASAGYIVVMADYPGFGDSTEPHPYVQLSLGKSVLTMLQQAKKVLDYLPASARWNQLKGIYLIGYSEGGFVTMAAARTLKDASLPLVAAVPCAGSYDLSGAMLGDILKTEAAVSPYYLPYTVHGYAASYRMLDNPWLYRDLLQTAIADSLDYYFSGGQTSTVINAAIGVFPPYKVVKNMLADGLADQLGEYLRGVPPASPTPIAAEVYRRLRENTVFHTDWVPDSLVQMIHCREDDVVPVGNAAAVFMAYNPNYPQYLDNPNILPPILVPALSLPSDLASLADTHLLAFPTAMIAGFTFIETVNAHL
jgi:pimeloyl-ACP methyl ester carboxylesterase